MSAALKVIDASGACQVQDLGRPGWLRAGVPEGGVRVRTVVESEAPLLKRYQPHHPSADAEGYVSTPNVNVVEEMADMISASRAYQANIEAAGTAKDLAMQTLSLGR